MSALAVRQQQAVAVRDAAIDPRTVGPHTHSPGVGPILATPLPAEDGIHGAVSIGRTAPGSPFSDGDTAMMTEFAANAGLAVQLESARRREERHDPGSGPERDPQHIAHDLTADLTQDWSSTPPPCTPSTSAPRRAGSSANFSDRPSNCTTRPRPG